MASIVAKSYAMTEIAGRGLDCCLDPIVSFLTINRIIYPPSAFAAYLEKSVQIPKMLVRNQYFQRAGFVLIRSSVERVFYFVQRERVRDERFCVQFAPGQHFRGYLNL